MTLPATDTFTGTNGTLLPTYNASWTNASNRMAIQSNRASGYDSGNVVDMAYWNADSFNAAHYSKGTYGGTATSGKAPGPAVRCQAGAVSLYQAFCDTTTCYAGQTVANVPTDWDSGQTVAIGDVVELRIDANVTTTVYLYIAGSLKATYTSKSTLSGGAAGVCMFNSAAAVGVDDWEGGNTGGAAAPPPPQHAYLQAVQRAAFY